MKKILLSITAIVAAMSVNAQQNLGFETWATSNPTGWGLPGYEAVAPPNAVTSLGTFTIAGVAALPVTQQTTGAIEGASYARIKTGTLSNPVDPSIPTGPTAGVISQVVPYTLRAASVSFQYKSALPANDSSAAYVELRKEGEVIGVGRKFISGNNASWTTGTMNITYYTGDQPDTIQLIFISSAGDLFGGTIAAAVDNSQLELDGITIGAPLAEAAAVTALTTTDISDNGDGSDLKVTFTVPADESTISEYRLFLIQKDYIMNWATAPVGSYAVIAKNGANQTYTYTSAGQYLAIAGGSSLALAPIVENVAMDAYVYSVPDGTNATVGRINGPSTITLTSGGVTGLNDLSLESNEIRVYPNPANNVINFAFGTSSASSIKVYSMTGQLMTVMPVTETTSINLDTYSSGMYIYQVTGTNNELLKTARFQVVK